MDRVWGRPSLWYNLMMGDQLWSWNFWEGPTTSPSAASTSLHSRWRFKEIFQYLKEKFMAVATRSFVLVSATYRYCTIFSSGIVMRRQRRAFVRFSHGSTSLYTTLQLLSLAFRFNPQRAILWRTHEITEILLNDSNSLNSTSTPPVQDALGKHFTLVHRNSVYVGNGSRDRSCFWALSR